MELIEIAQGDFLEAPEISTFWLSKISDTRYVRMVYLRWGMVQGGVNITAPDSGLVATLTFKVINFSNGTNISFMNTWEFRSYWHNSLTGIKTAGDEYDFEFMLPITFVFEKPTN